MSALDQRLKAKAEMIPEEGFNLVGLDDFEEPGDELYLIGNYPSREAAEKAKGERLGENPSEKLFIYGPNDA